MPYIINLFEHWVAREVLGASEALEFLKKSQEENH